MILENSQYVLDRRAWLRWTGVACLANLLPAGCGRKAPEPQKTEVPTDARSEVGTDPAVAAALARQRAVRSLVVEFRQTEVQPQGAISDCLRGFPEEPRFPVPAETTTLTSVNKLIIDGDKARFENNHPVWSALDWALHSSLSISVTNGSVGKCFWPRGHTDDGPPVGIVKNGTPIGLGLLLLTPIILTFRGLVGWNYVPRIDEWNPTGDRTEIDGSPCVKYIWPRRYECANGCLNATNDPDAYLPRDIFWLDEGKDYVVRRHRTPQRGRDYQRSDITYHRHEICGWVPVSWLCELYPVTGVQNQTIRVEVVSLTVNETQQADQFEITFPEGCQVSDQKNHKDYLVQTDGSMREYDPATRQVLSDVVPRP